MRTSPRILFAAMVMLAGDLAAQYLVGVSFNGSISTLNAVSGIGTSLGSLGFNWAGGLARIDDLLYTNDLGGRLWTIDPRTGVATGGAQTSPALNSVRAMAATQYGDLLVIQNGGGQTGTTTPDQLYRVDARTGAAVLAASTSPFVGIQGLATNRVGQIYGWDTNAGLVTISSTGVTTDVNPAVGATADIQALAFAPNGVLYGARHGLYTIDLATGVPTLVGSGGYSDVRGLEWVHAPRIYENGPVVTHPGSGFAGGDLSMVQTNLGLQYSGWAVDPTSNVDVIEDFQTNGPWVVEGFEFFVFVTVGAIPALSTVKLSIWNNHPVQGGVPVPGSPPVFGNLLQLNGFVVSETLTDIYRASPQNPFFNQNRLQRVRILLAAPLTLDSSTLPSGRYWLRFSCGLAGFTMAVPPVTTLGIASRGNAALLQGFSVLPMVDGGGGVALPFSLFGTASSPAAAITNLGGGCGAASPTLSVRGATCAGGSVVHEFASPGVLAGLVIGIGDPNLSFSPLCSCVLHADLDFVSIGVPRYDLVAPPGVGTGFEYRVQGLQLDFVGAAGLPCDAGLGFDFRLTDAYRVRFW